MCIRDRLLPLPHGAVWLRGYLVLDTMLFLEQATVYRLALLLPLLAVVAALGGYLLTRRAFRPIARMTRQAERILDGRDLTQRFPEGRDEVGRLGSSFNAMLERLSASFERERRFTDDASHELRTPLAVMTAACDFALEQGLSLIHIYPGAHRAAWQPAEPPAPYHGRTGPALPHHTQRRQALPLL